LHYLSEAQAAKKFGKGSGSGSGSKQIIWSNSPQDGDEGSQPLYWKWQYLQLIVAGLLLSVAAVLGGLTVARRLRAPSIPAPLPQ
jgi:hypothetical protein